MNIRQWIGRAALLAGALLACLLLPAAHAADFLDPEDAFKFSAAISDGGKTVEARFSIADGYYLYRERFGFAASDGDSTWCSAVSARQDQVRRNLQQAA